MKHLGDITKVRWEEVLPVYCVCGGSPCQDLSIAGKREGLAGERSGLYMVQIEAVKRLRKEDEKRGRTAEFIRPRYMVWENVTGAFSSNKGGDFSAVLEEAVKIVRPDSPPLPVPNGGWPYAGVLRDGVGGRWSIAWRTHDAQYWGVPQRRRRISLVCDFGGDTAAEILFEREGVSGDFETSGTPWEKAPGTAGGGIENTSSFALRMRSGCAGGGKGPLIQEEKSGTLATGNDQTIFCFGVDAYNQCETGNVAKTRNSVRTDTDHVPLVCEAYGETGRGYWPPGVKTIRCSGERPGSPANVVVYNGENITSPLNRTNPQPGDPCHTLTDDSRNHVVVSAGFKSQQSEKASIGYAEELMPTLSAEQKDAVLVLNDQGGSVMNTSENVVGTLRAQEHGHQPIIYCMATQQGGAEIRSDDKAPTLTAAAGMSGNNQPVVYDARGNGDGTICPTITGNHNGHVSDYTALCIGNGTEDEKNGSIQASACHNLNSCNTVRIGTVVRRLTPLECERLQGFPDNWTLIGEPILELVKDYHITYDADGNEVEKTQIGTHYETNYYYTDRFGKRKKCSDSVRYKALGNSIALPFWYWLLGRISKYCVEETPTMGSLFDGIGGFPLCWEMHNGAGTALWASEIEDFPIEVTMRRFPEKAETDLDNLLAWAEGIMAGDAR